MRHAIFTLTAAVLATAAAAPGATAAPYDLEYQGCIGTVVVAPSCSLDPALRSNDVAVSADGRNVYVVGGQRGGDGLDDGTLTVYARAADGSLSQAGCFSDTGGGACGAAAAIPALRDANAVALAPDGTSLYVAARGDRTAEHPGAVLAFARGKGGALTYQSCIGAGTRDRCADGKAATGLGSPDDLVVSPSGDRVVVGGRRAFVVDYRRTADGSLAFTGCVGATSPRCAPSTRLGNVTAIAISGDGRDLYAATTAVAGVAEYDAVVHLVAETGGGLVEVDCTGTPGSSCPRTSAHLRLPTGLVVTPDDGELFLTAQDPPVVTRFLRGPSGSLSEFGCVNSLESLGCGGSGVTISGVDGVAASPAGSGVYAGVSPTRLMTYARRPDPGLTPIRCQVLGFAGCAFEPIPGVAQLAFSPDGANLYLATVALGFHIVQIYRRAP